MTGKMKIVYIGPNEEKKISRGFTQFIFPRGMAVAVDEQIGFEFLKFKDTFATPEMAEKVMSENQANQKAQQDLAEAQRKKQAQEDAADTFLVIIDGVKTDISKFTKAKLATVVISESLPIDTNSPEVKEGETPVEALRNRIRETLHEKHGNPELEEA